MKIGKVLSSVSIIFSIFANYSNAAQVSMEFNFNGEVVAKCNDQTKIFKNITELNENFNNLFGNYMIVNHISIDENHINTIIFEDIQNGTNHNTNFHLNLRGNNICKPHLVLKIGPNGFELNRFSGYNISLSLQLNNAFMPAAFLQAI